MALHSWVARLVTSAASWKLLSFPARAADTQFSHRVISTIANDVNAVVAADLDGDDDLVVLSTSVYDSKISWYENDGGPHTDFAERVITNTAWGATSVFVAGVLLDVWLCFGHAVRGPLDACQRQDTVRVLHGVPVKPMPRLIDPSLSGTAP